MLSWAYSFVTQTNVGFSMFNVNVLDYVRIIQEKGKGRTKNQSHFVITHWVFGDIKKRDKYYIQIPKQVPL